jgi:hypothetical protein
MNTGTKREKNEKVKEERKQFDDYDSGARGPEFDPTPKPRTAFIRKLLSPFFQTTDLKTIVIYCDVKLK